jgi:hypothetical protein
MAWAAAAAPRVADVRAEAAAVEGEVWIDELVGLEYFSVPLWALQRAWWRLRGRQRTRAAARAAFHGDLAVLRWALAKLSATGAHYCDAAAAGGQLEALQYVRTLGYPWDAWSCSAAAAGGHLAVLQWMHAQEPPCRWDEWTCSGATRGGHLAVLQWVRTQEPPCPWDEETCSAAAEGGHLRVLQWARAQEPPCPWDAKECLHAAGRGKVARWIRERLRLDALASLISQIRGGGSMK